MSEAMIQLSLLAALIAVCVVAIVVAKRKGR